MSEPTIEEASVAAQTGRPTDSTPPQQPSPPAHDSHSDTDHTHSDTDHTHSDTDHTHSDLEDEGLLDASATGEELTQLLRKTVEELELALEVTNNPYCIILCHNITCTFILFRTNCVAFCVSFYVILYVILCHAIG